VTDEAPYTRAMHTNDIAPSEWPTFFNSFSRQHEGWLVTIEELPGGEGSPCIEAHDLPLEGISFDRLDGSISIALGADADGRLTHTVHHASRVIVERTDAGADCGLRINRDHDEATRIRFRSAVHPEQVDGLVGPPS